MHQLIVGVFAAVVIVCPVALFSTVVAVFKDGSPLTKEFWT